MVKYVIRGGKPLAGEVSISGAKNAACAVLPAALMVNGVCRIENVPKISDVTTWLEIMRELGARVSLVNSSTVEIDSTHVRNVRASYDLVRSMRASYYLIGAMLGRFGSAQVAMPGGCDFGVRPIDQHIKGFNALGAAVEVKNGFVHAGARDGALSGATVYFDLVTVGATINVMLAAALTPGLTVIESAAKEPHVVDVANFLNLMGADIKGAGTDVIKIRGVERLGGGTYTIIPDQIEAGSYMVAAAAVGGDVLISNVIPKHLECISAKLVEMGTEIEEYDDAMRVVSSGALSRANVKTLPYPGFPTDMQPQIAAALTLARGTSVITEGIYDNRYRYVDELKRMGARIQVDGKIAVIEGVKALTGAQVRACDLRAGIALVIAGLCARGETEIEAVGHIERGYEDVVEKFAALGADIARVTLPGDEIAHVG